MQNSIIKHSLVFLFAVAIVILPELALAQSTNNSGFGTIVNGICNVAGAAQSGPVKALLVIIVLFMGVGAFFGKVNWGLVVMVTAGIAGALGAAAIAEIVTGENCEESSTAIPTGQTIN